jgi:hypothetical protein
MDLDKIELKTVKTVSIVVAIVIGIAGIAAHFLGHDYIALGLIVIAAFEIFAGSLFMRYLYERRRFKDID